MISKYLVLIALIANPAASSAEVFHCAGSGRFEDALPREVELDWNTRPQAVLSGTKTLKIQVSLDKSNSDGTHYLAIEVLELDANGATAIRGAKGSLKDMVAYFDGPDSQLLCLPLKAH